MNCPKCKNLLDIETRDSKDYYFCEVCDYVEDYVGTKREGGKK